MSKQRDDELAALGLGDLVRIAEAYEPELVRGLEETLEIMRRELLVLALDVTLLAVTAMETRARAWPDGEQDEGALEFAQQVRDAALTEYGAMQVNPSADVVYERTLKFSVLRLIRRRALEPEARMELARAAASGLRPIHQMLDDMMGRSEDQDSAEAVEPYMADVEEAIRTLEAQSEPLDS